MGFVRISERNDVESTNTPLMLLGEIFYCGRSSHGEELPPASSVKASSVKKS